MLYKFENRITEFRLAYWLSGGLHLAGAAAVAYLFLGIERKTVVPLDLVIETPVASVNAPPIPEIKKPAQQSAMPKKKAVFGVSEAPVADAGAVKAKKGNTVAVAPDKKQMLDSDSESLPIPSDEILVSRMPRLKRETRIPYPEGARRAKVQGVVVLDLLVDGYGKVRESKLVSGPGFGLNEAALEAAKSFEFEPALIQEKPVAVRIRYAYRFILE